MAFGSFGEAAVARTKAGVDEMKRRRNQVPTSSVRHKFT